MKGITHFAVGVCAATFIPGLVEAASPLIALGGVAGLLPDTLDFRFARFFEHHDDEIELGEAPHRLNPQAMAERIARQMDAVLEDGEPRTIQLHTMRLGADRWRRYWVQFKSETDEVVVRIGPMVTTSLRMLPGAGVMEEGRYQVQGRIVSTYDELFPVDIFTGPSFRFEKIPLPAYGRGDDRQEPGIRVRFLLWHRRWSHSLILAAALGGLAWFFAGWQAGAVLFAGMAAHALCDHLGFMGGNLLWPISKRRFSGLRLFHSGDPTVNLAAVWVALVLILWNLDLFSPQPQLNGAILMALSIGLPLLVGVIARIWRRKSGTEEKLLPGTPRRAGAPDEVDDFPA